MSLIQALLAFVVAAGLLTVTPGLDTALVLRTAATDGGRRAVLAALGIQLGCLAWGLAVALGLGLLLTASQAAYTILRLAGAAYLIYLGASMILKPRREWETGPGAQVRRGQPPLLRGLLTNLLNPKIGVFYISFLPQFVPAGAPVGAFVFALACLHVVMNMVWFGVLIAAMRPLKRALQRPGVVTWLDRVTGLVFVGFGARLALVDRH